jgi:hypothetical protein
MPWIWYFLTGVMIAAIVRWVLMALGLGVLYFFGIEPFFEMVANSVDLLFDGAPPAVLSLLGIARVDEAVNIILGAFAFNVALMVYSRLGQVRVI